MTKKIRFRKEDFELVAEFRYRLRCFLRFSEQAALNHGLAPQQYQALLAIEGFPGRARVTVGELAERLQTTHHSAVGLVNRLERSALVRRPPDPEDRRKVHVSLTPEGRRLLKAIYALHRKELQATGPQLVALLQKAAEQIR